MVGIDDETGDGGEAKDSRRVNVLAVTGDLLVDVGRALRVHACPLSSGAIGE